MFRRELKVNMNKILKSSFLIVLTIVQVHVFAAAGFFGSPSGAVLSYTHNGGAMTTTSSFGTNIGNATTLVLNGAYIHTWKDANGNVCGGTLNYRIYPSANTPSGAFSQLSLSFSSNHSFTTVATPSNITSGGGNDQRWGQTTASIDLLTGLTANTQYRIEFYFEASGSVSNSSGCTDNMFYSNFGSNYTIDFTPVPPVPVKLIHFGATKEGNAVSLDWSTASEHNASHFTVYKSLDGIEKYALGNVAARGNSFKTNEYSFTDNESIDGKCFYFLKQIDFDGRFEWYGPVKIEAQEANNISAFFRANGNMQIGGDIESFKKVRLLTLEGKIVFEHEFNPNTNMISLPILQRGMYLLELSNDSNIKVIKVLK